MERGRTGDYRDQDNDENMQRGKRKYRLNKKRFVLTIVLLAVIATLCISMVIYVSEAFSQEGKPAAIPSASTTASSRPTVSVGATDALKGKIIVLDAGHGGFDRGATGVSGVREDELNLKVAKYLKAELENKGVKVIMTRSDDNAIADTKQQDMDKRRQIIQDSHSDIVISIHMNSHTDPATSGPLVIFMQNSVPGKTLADLIMKKLNDTLSPSSEGTARGDDFFILESGSQPCVIVECGFISNAKEEAKLKQSDYQQEIAKAICAGAEEYFSQSAGN